MKSSLPYLFRYVLINPIQVQYICLCERYLSNLSVNLVSFLSHALFQLEGLISLLYWSLLYYDERLLKHPGVPTLPFLLDLSFHLFPAILLWADFLFFSRQFVRSPRHITYIFTFAAAYCAWAHLCFYKNGLWPYPILAKFTTPYRFGFFALCALFCTIVYEAGECGWA